MPRNMPEKTTGRQAVVLELTVNNHPGVMSHICGLFSRRAYNLEKILCLPDEGGGQSRMWLQVNEEERLEQVVKQLQKLADVRDVVPAAKGSKLFQGIEEWLAVEREGPAAT